VNEKRPIQWWRLWPVLGFLGLGVLEVTGAMSMNRPIDWLWIGIAIAGAVVVVIARVVFRI